MSAHYLKCGAVFASVAFVLIVLSCNSPQTQLNYPSIWFELVNDPQKSDCEILPEQAGQDDEFAKTKGVEWKYTRAQVAQPRNHTPVADATAIIFVKIP